MVSEVRKGKNGNDGGGQDNNPHNWGVIEGGKKRERPSGFQKLKAPTPTPREILRGLSDVLTLTKDQMAVIKKKNAMLNSILFSVGLTPEDCPYTDKTDVETDATGEHKKLFHMTLFRPLEGKWDQVKLEKMKTLVKEQGMSMKIYPETKGFIVASVLADNFTGK